MRFKPETGQKILIRGLSWYPNYVLNEDSQILCPYFFRGYPCGGYTVGLRERRLLKMQRNGDGRANGEER